jgi:uncharacterized protein YegP (UPF0339 family)
MAAEFELIKDATDKYRCRLQAGNNEIVAQSEAYESRDAAMDGIDAVRTAAASATVNDRTGDA